MNKQTITTVISIAEQGKIIGGIEIKPKDPRRFLDSIKEIFKPTPTIPYPIFNW